MNTSVLQKCVDELKKEQPNVPYILGMLETFIELSGNTKKNEIAYPNPIVGGVVGDIRADEDGEIPAAARPGPIGRIS